MKTVCLINHYQYGDYVGEAIESAVSQGDRLDEIVVVDDGSDEEHLGKLRAAADGHPKVRLIEKSNGGQLSCFQAGLEATDADAVFFLDADDTWEPGYVDQVLDVLAGRPDIDVVYTNELRVFADGRQESTPKDSSVAGYSQARSLTLVGKWRGQPTSCIAMRRSTLDRIFPLDLGLARGWRTCADEALVYGSAVVGAQAYFLGTPLVRYRIHDRNHFYGRPYDARDRLVRGVEVLRLIETLRRRQSLPASLAYVAHHEFRTIEAPTKADYREYCRLVKSSDLSGHRKRRLRVALWGWYRLRKRL